VRSLPVTKHRDDCRPNGQPTQRHSVPGLHLTTFPAGVAASGSKAGSSSTIFHDTPRVRSELLGSDPQFQENSVRNRRSPDGVQMHHGDHLNGANGMSEKNRHHSPRILAARPDAYILIKISAGNYDGRLGKSFISLARNLIANGISNGYQRVTVH